jgi:hypothetical protein
MAGGRPKTTVREKLAQISFDPKKIETLGALGLTDVQIGSVLGVTEMTLNLWKKDKEFLIALKKGKELADSKVVESLYRRATGYDHKDTYFSSYQGDVTATPYTKHYPPDVVACIFWLKNRQKGEWRDVQDFTSGGEKIGSVQVTIVKSK